MTTDTEKPRNLGGRPSEFNQNIADRICAGIACGDSLRTVCLEDDMPNPVTVYRWLRINTEFCKQYELAKVDSADAMAEDILEIADNGLNDWMEIHDKEGECVGYRVNGEHVQRSKLRLEARKFLMGKLKPKKYGALVDGNLDPGTLPMIIVNRPERPPA